MQGKHANLTALVAGLVILLIGSGVWVKNTYHEWSWLPVTQEQFEAKLNERLKDVATKSELAALDGRLKVLEVKFETATANLQKAIDTSSFNQTKALADAIKNWDGSIDELIRPIPAMLATLESSLKTFDERLGKNEVVLETDVKKLGEQLNAVAKQTDAVKKSIGKVNVPTLAMDVSLHSVQIKSVAEKVKSVTENVGALQKRVAAIKVAHRRVSSRAYPVKVQRPIQVVPFVPPCFPLQIFCS